jgi:uncharacterized protein YcbX
MPAATVSGLFVHPLKSCRGIACDAVEVTRTGFATGAARDREWMVVDRNGRFVSQREAPRLALVEVSVERGAVHLSAAGHPPVALEPGGAARDVVVWSAHVGGFDAGDAAAALLSAHLGRDVRLVRFDDSRPRRCNPDYAGDSGATTLFSDGYPVLVLGQASLADLNRRLGEQRIAALPMNRFRPNLVLEGLEPYDEDHVDTLAIGGVVLKLVKPCTRCEITTTDQASARRGIEPLRTLSTYRRDDRLAGVTFGMNAIVVEGEGRRIARGDAAIATFAF